MLPLEGIRVLDLSTMIAGPATAMLLGDLGADVVKVESPAGDDLRYMNASHDPDHAPFFLAVNRNKRGIVLDLRRPEGVAVARRLVDAVDVLVHNFRGDVLDKIDFGWDSVRVTNPRLIHCTISAWGEVGPWASRPGIDSLVQAAGGLMSITGEADGAQLRTGAPLIDMTTPVSAVAAVLAALRVRDRTGAGQAVSVSLLAQGIYMQGPMFTHASATATNPPRMGNRSPMALILEARTPTGGMLVGIPTERLWRKLCAAIDRVDLLDEPDFRGHATRLRNQERLASEIEPLLAAEPREVWLERLVAAGIPCAPINDYAGARANAQVVAIDALLPLHANGPAGPSATVVPNVPWRLAGAGASIRLDPPPIGRDTVSVLREIGLDDDEIAGLDADGTTRGAYAEPT